MIIQHDHFPYCPGVLKLQNRLFLYTENHHICSSYANLQNLFSGCITGFWNKPYSARSFPYSLQCIFNLCFALHLSFDEMHHADLEQVAVRREDRQSWIESSSVY